MTLSMEDLLDKLVASKTDPNDQIYAYLCTTDVRRLKDLLSRLDLVRNYKAKNAKRRGRKANATGRAFEAVVRCLFEGCHALKSLNNVRSTSSEIDFLVEVQPLAGSLPFLQSIGTHMMGEAKCVMSGMKKEWIDELRGIMETHGTRRAILFTGVTPRKVDREPRMAIALHAQTGNLIVPFGLTQIAQVASGQNFLKLLGRQTLHATNHLSDLQV